MHRYCARQRSGWTANCTDVDVFDVFSGRWQDLRDPVWHRVGDLWVCKAAFGLKIDFGLQSPLSKSESGVPSARPGLGLQLACGHCSTRYGNTLLHSVIWLWRLFGVQLKSFGWGIAQRLRRGLDRIFCLFNRGSKADGDLSLQPLTASLNRLVFGAGT